MYIGRTAGVLTDDISRMPAKRHGAEERAKTAVVDADTGFDRESEACLAGWSWNKSKSLGGGKMGYQQPAGAYMLA